MRSGKGSFLALMFAAAISRYCWSYSLIVTAGLTLLIPG